MSAQAVTVQVAGGVGVGEGRIAVFHTACRSIDIGSAVSVALLTGDGGTRPHPVFNRSASSSIIFAFKAASSDQDTGQPAQVEYPHGDTVLVQGGQDGRDQVDRLSRAKRSPFPPPPNLERGSGQRTGKRPQPLPVLAYAVGSGSEPSSGVASKAL